MSVFSVHHALAPSDPSRIVLYLPSGARVFRAPTFTSGPDYDDFIVEQLVANTSATVVRVNYRFGAGFAWPTPIHDVLAGYDWVVKELAPDLRRNSPTSAKQRHARLSVCGQLVGGSLATALALTECRMGDSRVVAAAVNNPIGEWVFPSDLKQLPGTASDLKFGTAEELANSVLPSKRRAKKADRASWDANANNAQLPPSVVLQARDTLLKRPSQWLDPFASPILFFRSAGIGIARPGDVTPASRSKSATAPDEAPDEPYYLDGPLDDDMYYDHTLDSAAQALDSTTEPSATPLPRSGILDEVTGREILVQRRRAHRIHPPLGSALRLPSTRITTALSSPLQDQATELAMRMRRSLVRTAVRSHAHVHPDVESLDGDEARLDAGRLAEARIQLDVHSHAEDDVGLWSSSAQGEERVREVGKWLMRKLG